MSAKLFYDSYKHAGNEEHILLSQPIDSIDYHILLIPPFFAEMNKMRRTLVEVMRLLSEHSIKCSMPDLPGCNESLTPLNQQSFNDWQAALQACADQKEISHIASFRGGALIDSVGKPIWRLNSVKGANLIKTMLRSKVIALKEAGQDISIDQLQDQAQNDGIELAGYEFNADLFNQLKEATPQIDDNVTQFKLGQDIEGSPLWLRSEPEYDEILAQSIAQSLLKWCSA